MSSSVHSLSKLKTITVKDFLALEPNEDRNYIYQITDHENYDLLKKTVDVKVLLEDKKTDTVSILVCIWVSSENFKLHLPVSHKDQSIKLASNLEGIKKSYLKILVEVDKVSESGISVKETCYGDTTDYSIFPYSGEIFQSPFLSSAYFD